MLGTAYRSTSAMEEHYLSTAYITQTLYSFCTVKMYVQASVAVERTLDLLGLRLQTVCATLWVLGIRADSALNSEQLLGLSLDL